MLLALIWGCSFLLIQLGLRSLTPVGVAFGRLVLGATRLLLVSAVTRTALPPRGVWRHLFVVALLLNSVPFTLFAYGETQISSSLAGIINGAAPLATVHHQSRRARAALVARQKVVRWSIVAPRYTSRRPHPVPPLPGVSRPASAAFNASLVNSLFSKRLRRPVRELHQYQHQQTV